MALTRKLVPLILWIIAIGACQSNPDKKMEKEYVSFFVGTYTNKDSEGIYHYGLGQDGQLVNLGLAAATENPSFLAVDKDRQVLLAVNEVDQNNRGGITSFKITGDSLSAINRESTGGAHPCHVAIIENGYVLVANYTGGSVGLLKLKKDGAISNVLDLQQHRGKGTAARQDGPHAHSAWFNPYDKSVIAVDLGTNQLWFYDLDTAVGKLTLSAPSTLTMAPGAGPRHLAIHPQQHWLYVINELNATVALVKPSGTGFYEIAQTLSTLPKGYSGDNTCADIKISGDGRFLYASNRGHNSIAVFSIDARDGSLQALGHVSTRGDGPRNFSISPDGKFLLVANQHTDNIISFKRDTNTGLLYFLDEISAPTPVCILFYQ